MYLVHRYSIERVGNLDSTSSHLGLDPQFEPVFEVAFRNHLDLPEKFSRETSESPEGEFRAAQARDYDRAKQVFLFQVFLRLHPEIVLMEDYPTHKLYRNKSYCITIFKGDHPALKHLQKLNSKQNKN